MKKNSPVYTYYFANNPLTVLPKFDSLKECKNSAQEKLFSFDYDSFYSEKPYRIYFLEIKEIEERDIQYKITYKENN